MNECSKIKRKPMALNTRRKMEASHSARLSLKSFESFQLEILLTLKKKFSVTKNGTISTEYQ